MPAFLNSQGGEVDAYSDDDLEERADCKGSYKL